VERGGRRSGQRVEELNGGTTVGRKDTLKWRTTREVRTKEKREAASPHASAILEGSHLDKERKQVGLEQGTFPKVSESEN